MNKKAFTLVELLAVIALLALLTGIAVPNIISTINNNKRQNFLIEARRMVAKASSLLSSSKSDRNTAKSSKVVYTFTRLNSKGEFPEDPDGFPYNSNSYVKITYNSSTKKYQYCICLLGEKRGIGSTSSCNSSYSNNCVDSESLNGIDVVKDR